IEEGKNADIILLDLKNPVLRPLHNKERIISDLVYSTPSLAVNTVIIDGKLIMQNKKILTIDEKEIYEKVEECTRELFG
ncbi:MAG: N-ethylammeline chlorohydrolase, partial [Candidatus Aenigmatarchaeota archaeon]